jgi:L-seryl-tRNA(Ser) seleniumtransferase
MALPPWTVELLRRGVADLARQVTDNETAASLKEQATKLVDELPKAAREKVDSLLKQAEASTRPIKDAWQTGSLWGGGPISLTPTRLINGTGCLLDPRGSGVGIATESLAAAIPFLSGDAARRENLEVNLCAEIASAISRRCDHDVSGDHTLGAIVTTSLDASLALVASLGQRGGCLWVPRSCAVPMNFQDAGNDALLVDRLRRFGRGSVREFGLPTGDLQWPSEPFADDHGGRYSDRPGHDRGPRQHVLVHLASEKSAMRISTDQRTDWVEVAVLPLGSIFPLSEKSDTSHRHAPSLIEQLNGGADIVVLQGGVLSSTPGQSLIVGRESIIERLRQTPHHSLVTAPLAIVSMVASSVKLQSTGQSPIQQLTGVSTENLNDRAQRLATQLAACEWVASARVSESFARIGLPPIAESALAAAKPEATYPSRQVVVTLTPSHDAETLSQRFASAATGLLCRVENGELIIDLRWISPEQQAQISELAGQLC